jgi:Family of unknown function (DUF6009)
MTRYRESTTNADLAARGEITVYQGDRPVSRRLTAREMEAYERAKRRGFVVARGNVSGREVSNACYRWCAGAGRPFIHVRPRVKYATVSVDPICCEPARLTKDQAGRLRKAWEPLGLADMDSPLSGAGYVYLERVPLELAEKAAGAAWEALKGAAPVLVVQSDGTVTDSELAAEETVHWLVDIEEYDYVRVRVERLADSRRRPLRHSGGFRTLGYSVLRPDAFRSAMHHSFTRRIFWVKDYDRDSGDDCYRVGAPCEGVDPRTVRPGVAGWKTDRAFGRSDETGASATAAAEEERTRNHDD